MQCSAFLAPVRCPEEVFHQARRTAPYPSVQSVLCEDWQAMSVLVSDTSTYDTKQEVGEGNLL